MDLDLLFRVTFGLAMAVSIAISSYHRILARRASGTIPRTAEGPLAVALRLLMTLPALATIGAYLFAPAWLRWAQFDVAFGVRMAAACVVAIVPLLVLWVFTSIGSNISETVLTKTRHTLVTHGPYRWVRHPLYAVALLALLALGLMAANALLLLMWALGTAIFRLIVIPREETHLIQRFGAAYERYRAHTGALLPGPGAARTP